MFSSSRRRAYALVLLAAVGCQRSTALCTASAGCFDAAAPDLRAQVPPDAAVADLLSSVDLLSQVPGWTESLRVLPQATMMGIAPGIVEVWDGGYETPGGFWRTDDDGATWTRHLFPEESFQFGDSARTASGRLFVGGDTAMFAHPIWFSDDQGVTWQSAKGPALTGNPALLLAASGTAVYAFAGGGSLPGLLRSVDNGSTWDVTQSLPYQGVEAIHASGDGRLWLGTGLGAGGYTVFFSDDQGDSWQPATFFTRFDTCEDAFSIQSAGETIFVLCDVVNPGPNPPFRLFRGNTGGTVFTDVSPNPGLGQSLFVLDAGRLWSGSDGGLVYFSDTAGDHWSETAIPASLDGVRHYNQIWSATGPDDFFIFNNDRRLSSLVAHYH